MTVNPGTRDSISSRRYVPRLIRGAVDDAQSSHALPAGYSPALSVQMAKAHRWAPYDAVAAALRSLALGNLANYTACTAARSTVRALFDHPTPFDAGVRFPEGALYLCVDRGKFGQAMYRVMKELARVEAAVDQYSWRIVQACEAFMEAVSAAAAEGTLNWPSDLGLAVVYNREIFEEAFHLTWTEDTA